MMKKVKKKENNRSYQTRHLIISIIGPLIGVVIGYILSQTSYAPNILYEQYLQMKRGIIEKQYIHLKKIKMFTQLSINVAALNYKIINISNSKKDTTYTKDTTLFVPIIVYDSTSYAEWLRLNNEIQNAKNDIDPEVYKIFNQILLFTERYPFSPTNNFDTLRLSPWSNSEIKDQWQQLNESLLSELEDFLSLTSFKF